MQLSDFTFELPEELIAKHPSAERTSSRLLYVNTPESSSEHQLNHYPELEHLIFKDIINKFNPGDLLILNNTKVIPARFYGQKSTGAKLEFLLERVVDNQSALIYIKANRAPKIDSDLELSNRASIKVLEKQGNLYLVKLNLQANSNQELNWYELLDEIGSLPLPPYIDRALVKDDQDRYQTVFAKHKGAVAAPTAGLHFDEALLKALEQKGVIIKYVTLHVGSGTFLPVRTENILDHKMHSENYVIPHDVITSINNIKQTGARHQLVQMEKNKIIAVGTTVLRCLESAANSIGARHQAECDITGSTDIFIYPGYEFKIVDSLITNFHLPGSTLMMLVSAFIGLENIKYCYQEAIDKKYRFFSYGDAMFLNKKIAL